MTHVSEVRLRPSSTATLESSLGLLAPLAGTWTGTGFNLIMRPNFEPIGGVSSDHFLEINLTSENLKFDFIGAPIPNRGLAQEDITLFGLHYLQQVSDSFTHGALHLEPGIWVNIPATTQPNAPVPAGQNNVARFATIPHGNALVAEGQAFKVAGGPLIEPANVTPFPIGGGAPIAFAEFDLSARNSFRSPLPPASVIPLAKLQAIVNDPNTLLLDAIKTQTILNSTVIRIATGATIPVTNTAAVTFPNAGGGVENIGFLNSTNFSPPPPVAPHDLPNALAADVFAIFWIEEVEHPRGGATFFQLQYTQTVYLNFAGLTWPHVSVATLVKSSVV